MRFLIITEIDYQETNYPVVLNSGFFKNVPVSVRPPQKSVPTE